MIPSSLNEVAEASLAGEHFGRSLANFLDGFYRAPSAQALKDRPMRLAEKISDGEVKDAYLAATAEELVRRFNFPAPDWIFEEDRKLHRPWFATSLQSLRGILIGESPLGFRSRNLFVSANALSRA
jgi:hypothetical protein